MSTSEQGGRRKWKLSAAAFRFLLNIYLPLLGAGIRIIHIAPDFRSLKVRMRLRFYNRNYFGTHYGGSLFSMADLGYALMLANILGRDYVVWDKSATIRYLAPGRGTVYAHFTLSEQQIAEIIERTVSGEKYEPVYLVDIVDNAGTTIASIERNIYLRKRVGSSL